MEVAQNAMAQIPRETKKRKLETVDHGCFDICNLVKELRPHFIEVLRSPDFRNSKAAQEIRQQTKLILDICEQITSGTIPLEETRKREKKPTSRSEYLGNGRGQQGPVVGGSNFGWNFIMYPGGDAVYYGVTKESFLASSYLKKEDIPS
ncbi:hypothetical protein Sjap_020867 [Stephania japonica]|uniref:Uncharacterized protein n=1 Tax=Stephania japonica TaxID=461633 RepID=A0AAP0F8U7_9MAGN